MGVSNTVILVFSVLSFAIGVIAVLLFGCLLEDSVYVPVDLENGEVKKGKLRFLKMFRHRRKQKELTVNTGEEVQDIPAISSTHSVTREQNSFQSHSNDEYQQNSSKVGLNSFPLDSLVVPTHSDQKSCPVKTKNDQVKTKAPSLDIQISKEITNDEAVPIVPEIGQDNGSNISLSPKVDASISSNFETKQINTNDETDQLVPTILAQPLNHSSKVNEFESPPVISTALTSNLQDSMDDKPDLNSFENGIIRQVSDPLLSASPDKYIKVGDEVVVIKPFKGRKENEFDLLEPGDIIRINKIFIMDDERNKDKISEGPISPVENLNLDNEITISKHDKEYKNIYCTGLLLRDSLEDLYSLPLKEAAFSTKMIQVTNDFPLSIVTSKSSLGNVRKHDAIPATYE
ncbi:uncharacterized protein KGF55_000710 [Candida pseudojiufengensis]|uniref:uncharacterized protein n=1 Tax=Candida pseudojiufengensis TaxID=497109 RepID=UPI0022257220|nr:uncharacterized protein KGF55_000710 [Candida pseudojiufengensis]KAI5966401.1 hypothetical protein KGF55_000710 [Candida pseudojiufengensis]